MREKRDVLGLCTVFLAVTVIVTTLLGAINRPVHAQLAAGGGFQYKKITTSACTIVQPNPAQLDAIIVSGPGTTWTIQIFDNATACSGTAIFGATAVTVPAAATKVQFDIQATNGIAILTAGGTAGELTVTYR